MAFVGIIGFSATSAFENFVNFQPIGSSASVFGALFSAERQLRKVRTISTASILKCLLSEKKNHVMARMRSYARSLSTGSGLLITELIFYSWSSTFCSLDSILPNWNHATACMFCLAVQVLPLFPLSRCCRRNPLCSIFWLPLLLLWDQV